MTGRDRIVMLVVVVLVVIGAGWMEVVSPERKKAQKLNTDIATAKTQLSTAENELASARAAEAQYPKAYASVVSLGKAVPPGQEVPSLIYQLAQASGTRNVEFNSIVSGTGGGTASVGASSSSAASTAANASTATAFTQMPFTFIFNGGFFELERLFARLDRFTTVAGPSSLRVSGRLLTIQSVKLAPSTSASVTTKPSATSKLQGTITASAYELPAEQGLTGAATPSSPTGSATPASTSSGSSSPTTPAIARVTP